MKDAGEYAANELLELANDWCEDAWANDAEEGEFTPLTAQDFMKKITLTSISIRSEGNFTFWYDDGDMFWGHSVSVDGNIDKGFDNASMQG